MKIYHQKKKIEPDLVPLDNSPTATSSLTQTAILGQLYFFCVSTK